MKKSPLLIATLVLLFYSCQVKNPQKRISGDYAKQSECLGIEMDGSQTIKTWGYGAHRFDAIEQAKKNAVRDVLFKGILNGRPDCNQKPIINEVNAQEKYEDYFNAFFVDEGPYKDFISLKDEPIRIVRKNRKAATDGVEFGVIVRVDRVGLRKLMIKDRILIL